MSGDGTATIDFSPPADGSSAGSNDDALWVELTTLTGWSRERWQYVKTMSSALQQAVLTEAKDQDWSDPSTPLGTKVLALLAALGVVAGSVGSVAGAAGAVKSL